MSICLRGRFDYFARLRRVRQTSPVIPLLRPTPFTAGCNTKDWNQTSTLKRVVSPVSVRYFFFFFFSQQFLLAILGFTLYTRAMKSCDTLPRENAAFLVSFPKLIGVKLVAREFQGSRDLSRSDRRGARRERRARVLQNQKRMGASAFRRFSRYKGHRRRDLLVKDALLGGISHGRKRKGVHGVTAQPEVFATPFGSSFDGPRGRYCPLDSVSRVSLFSCFYERH